MKYLWITAIGLMLLLPACTYNTEIYTYDENGIEKKVARVWQNREGLATYEMRKEKVTINVDTRHKNWFERNIMPLFGWAADNPPW